MFLPLKDGTLSDQKSDTALFFAEYLITFDDRYNTRYKASDAFEDLTQKLISLYGEEYETRENIDSYRLKHHLWHGGNGTMVSITLMKGKGYDYINIGYGIEEGDELMRQAYDAYILKMEKMDEVVKNSTDGL